MEYSLPKSLTALFAGLALSASASGTPFIAGENTLGGLEFTVDFGSFSYVSDLSQGGLRRTEATQGSQISFDPVVPAEDTNLFFDWSVFENPDSIDPNYRWRLPEQRIGFPLHSWRTGVSIDCGRNGSLERS